jgi:FkbM family methyltransferase
LSLLQEARREGGSLERRIIPTGKMILWPGDIVSEEIYLDQYEIKERFLLTRLLKGGMVFMDIGANIGLYSIIASRIVGRKGQVYAFEPSRVCYERLKTNISANKASNIIAEKLAVGADNIIIKLNVPRNGYQAWASIGNPSTDVVSDSEEAECIQLDEYIRKNKIERVDLIKIDVEGWEKNVLIGADNLLKSEMAPDLIVEFTEENAKRNGTRCVDLLLQLSSYGYSMYRYIFEDNALQKVKETDVFVYENILCLTKASKIRSTLKIGD